MSPQKQPWDFKRNLKRYDLYVFDNQAYKFDSIGNITWAAIMKSYGWPKEVAKLGAGVYQTKNDLKDTNTFKAHIFIGRLIYGSCGDETRDSAAIEIGYDSY